MSKKALMGGVFALAMVAIIIVGVTTIDWGFETNDEPVSVPFAPEADGSLSHDSINYVLFEVGPCHVDPRCSHVRSDHRRSDAVQRG